MTAVCRQQTSVHAHGIHAQGNIQNPFCIRENDKLACIANKHLPSKNAIEF